MNLGPSALLELEADDALAAARSVLGDIQRNVQTIADPRKLTAAHPWLGVGAAAVAGIVGAMLVVPSKEDAALKRLERIEAALGTGAAANGAANAHAAAPGGKRRSTLMRLLARQGFNMVRPMLLATLSGILSAKAVQDNPNDEPDMPADYDPTGAADMTDA